MKLITKIQNTKIIVLLFIHLTFNEHVLFVRHCSGHWVFIISLDQMAMLFIASLNTNIKTLMMQLLFGCLKKFLMEPFFIVRLIMALAYYKIFESI